MRNPSSPISYEKADMKPNSFLVSWGQGKIFCIRTYGCAANVRDSEVIRSFLLALGMKESSSFDESDFILFNTCAIRENAENHLYGELGQAKDRFEKHPDTVIAISGCVMQEEVPVKFVLDHFPFVSLIFGTNNIPSFYSLLEASIKDNKFIVDVVPSSNKVEEGFPLATDARNSKVSALVNITYGCDNFCTYCIVPYTRGKERSRKVEDILAEVNCLKKAGYKQVTLLGQNVDDYGKDFGDKYAFADLLEKVAQTGIARIRFMTPYPSSFNLKVFEIMAKYPNIMPAIHLPIQSGSDAILKRMNRHYTRAQYLDIVKALKEIIPDVYLTTDIIVGFPGETEEDFKDTLSICEIAKYDAAFTFIFSPRPGTPAYRMKDEFSMATKHTHFDQLKEVIERLTASRADTFVNQDVEVLFEDVSKKDPTMITGLDRHGKLVHVKGTSALIGQIRKVHILESHTYSLIGEVKDD